MYSMHVTSDQNRKSPSKKFNRKINTNDKRYQRKSTKTSNQLIYIIRKYLQNFCSSQTEIPVNEFEDQDGIFFNIKPEKIDILSNKTNFTKRELKIMYRSFKQDCPNGLVSEDTFKNIYQQFFPRGTDTSNYAHLVFKAFDIENSGALTFTDLIFGLNKLIRGSPEEKLIWSFKVYDLNRKGYLEREDFYRAFNAVQEIMGKTLNENTLVDEKDQLDKIFKKFGINQNNSITSEEFVRICLNDRAIIESLDISKTII